MGIRQLTAHLSPFGERIMLGYSNAPTKARVEETRECVERIRVVVDGPALAYHVYYKLLAWRPVSLPALLAAQPSYDEIGTAISAYLEKVEEYGIVM